MSYLEQQNIVEAENIERERRKIADELQIEKEEAEEAQARSRLDSNRKTSYSGVSQECEQNGKVNRLFSFLK